MTTYDLFIGNLISHPFIKNALVTCIALAISYGPLGVLLVLRRMSLVGDALSHAVLPGAACSYIFTGTLSLWAMSIGGIVSGLVVAFLSGFVSRTTHLKEDASFASFYLMFYAGGLILLSSFRTRININDLLFGTILGVSNSDLIIVCTFVSITLVALAIIYRPLVFESFDPYFLRSVGAKGGYPDGPRPDDGPCHCSPFLG